MNEILAFKKFSEKLSALNPYSMELTLERIKNCLNTLSHPEQTFRSIVVGGTNGKGSVVQMLTDAFLSSGFAVGTYTSPHLIQLNERIKINNKPVKYSELLRLSEKLNPCKQLTYFEFLTALAYIVFREYGVDMAILEVGMGGEFDATNTTDPLLSIITSISLDHTEHLGTTLEEIARTKSKIIKRLGVIGKNTNEVKNTIKHTLPHSKLFFVNDDYLSRARKTQTLMRGEAFKENLAIAMLAIDVLNREYNTKLSSSVMSKTYWPARVEVIESDPTFVIDGAHNLSAVGNLRKFYLRYHTPKTLIFSALNTKNWKEILNLTANDFADIKLPSLKHRLSLNPKDIASHLKEMEYQGKIEIFPSVNDAIQSCFGHPGVCVIAGSLYLAGEAKACLTEERFIP